MIDSLITEFPEAVLRKGRDKFVDVVFRIEEIGLDQRIKRFDEFAKRIEKFLIGKLLYVSYFSFARNIRASTCTFCIYVGVKP